MNNDEWAAQFERDAMPIKARVLVAIREETKRRKTANLPPMTIAEIRNLMPEYRTVIWGAVQALVSEGYVKGLGHGRGRLYYAAD